MKEHVDFEFYEGKLRIPPGFKIPAGEHDFKKGQLIPIKPEENLIELLSFKDKFKYFIYGWCLSTVGTIIWMICQK